MNPLPPKVNRGTLGELLAQVHLLVNGVQAAPPLRDSGNDLIACRGQAIRSLQVKTRKQCHFSKRGLPNFYDAVVFIVLPENASNQPELWKADIYMMSRSEVEATISFCAASMESFRITPERIDVVFGPRT